MLERGNSNFDIRRRVRLALAPSFTRRLGKDSRVRMLCLRGYEMGRPTSKQQKGKFSDPKYYKPPSAKYFMVIDFPGAKRNSNVTRFITAGKPGGCRLCQKWVEKLEAHHLKYSPEITINICHNCHHTIHFWPNRLSDNWKLKLLRLLFGEGKAWWFLDKTRDSPQDLARLIAPSRSKFVRSRQIKEIKRLKAKK